MMTYCIRLISNEVSFKFLCTYIIWRVLFLVLMSSGLDLQGKKGIWIKMSSELDNLVAPAKREGFEYHHDYLMPVSWISDIPSTIPANASHRASIAAFVLNNRKEVLVVQENGGNFEGTGVWKLPTGLIKEGEGIWAGAGREVQEEAGIETVFVQVLAFREGHRQVEFLGNKTDILYLCELKASTFEIKKQDSEILDAKWMPTGQFVDQPCHAKEKYKMLKLMADICLKEVGRGVLWFLYCGHPFVSIEKEPLLQPRSCQLPAPNA